MVVEERTRDEAAQYLFSPELQQELLRHPGQWVAVTKTELLGVGATAQEALAKSVELGTPHPMIYRVPVDGDTTYFF